MRHLAKASLLALLGACSAMGPDKGMPSLEERHPIAVDQQTKAMVVKVDPSLDGLGRDTVREIDAFVSAYRTAGHGPLTVTATSGSSSDIEVQQVAAEVRAALFAAGIPYEDMRGATVRSGASEGQVVLSFTRYVATGPVCGQTSNELETRFTGRAHADWGCATRANLAAMLADPRELHKPASADDTGDAALATAITVRSAAEAQGPQGGGGNAP